MYWNEAVYWNEAIDVHHIVPSARCGRPGKRIDRRYDDPIVSKRAIPARTNQTLGGRAPSRYPRTPESRGGIPPARMDGIPHRNRIEAAASRSDGFEVFFRARGEAPLRLIETAMGKVMARDRVGPGPTGDVSGDEEGEAA